MVGRERERDARTQSMNHAHFATKKNHISDVGGGGRRANDTETGTKRQRQTDRQRQKTDKDTENCTHKSSQ